MVRSFLSHCTLPTEGTTSRLHQPFLWRSDMKHCIVRAHRFGTFTPRMDGCCGSTQTTYALCTGPNPPPSHRALHDAQTKTARDHPCPSINRFSHRFTSIRFGMKARDILWHRLWFYCTIRFAQTHTSSTRAHRRVTVLGKAFFGLKFFPAIQRMRNQSI